MYNEDLFARAKGAIFGPAPKCPVALIGYNMAVNYYTSLILEAEPVLQNIAKPCIHLPTYLRNAFEFSSYGAFNKLPQETLSVLKLCNDNFRRRYEPLTKGLNQPSVQ